ncbi:swi5-dependent recombination DNA repair protein 1 homolog isoform X2 [Pseudophryne corroboree]|uniref:swi5-dependent recombination DNA repair protein 1 homolog isoform X2 n=1 Tax=Pseudophryne corroboree TaxID=495146 RepID=UPI003081A8B9
MYLKHRPVLSVSQCLISRELRLAPVASVRGLVGSLRSGRRSWCWFGDWWSAARRASIKTAMETPSMCSPSLTNSKKHFGSPEPQSSTSVKQPMSATLRERLRKSRRSFSSTCKVAKRLKIDGDEREIPVKCIVDASSPQDLEEHIVKIGQTCSPLSSADEKIPEGKTHEQASPSSATNPQHMLQGKKGLLKRVEEKEEVLRRLKMVKLYRSKGSDHFSTKGVQLRTI